MTENEVCQQSINSEVVLARCGDVIDISDVCQCCSLNGTLIDAQESLLRDHKNWDELLIEYAGTAVTSNVAQPFLLRADVQNYFMLKIVHFVIDAELIEDQLKDTDLFPGFPDQRLSGIVKSWCRNRYFYRYFVVCRKYHVNVWLLLDEVGLVVPWREL